MPIDTSSYYPEIDKPEEKSDNTSLNGVHKSLFGEKKPEEPVKTEREENLEKEEKPQDEKKKKKESGSLIDLLCNLISWVLVPLLMPTFGVLFIFRLSILDVVPNGLQTAFTFVVFGISCCIPLLLILLLKYLGVVDDYALNGRKERTLPYLISAICLGCTAWFMASRGAPVWVTMFFTGGAIAAVINTLINLKWKISAHAAGISGLIALLIRLEKDMAVEPQLFVWLLITIGVAGLLGSARVWLGRHTVWQVLAGYLVGFCSVFFMMFIR